MDACDVVVVGGGIAGLAAAAYASKGGASVTLLEASPALGGRARTRILSGYRFNQGAHALYSDGYLDGMLRDLGVAVTGGVPALATGFFVAGGTLHRAPFSAAGLAATTLLAEAEKGELALLLRRLADGSATAPSGASLREALAALSPSPGIRAVLAAMVRLTSIVQAPEAADGQALLDQLRGGLTRKVRYLDDGWGTMIDGLSAACARLGAVLHASSRVLSVERGAAWRVMLANGTAVRASAVVLALNPAQAAALFPLLRNLASVTEAVPSKVACLDIGLASLPRPDILFALDVDRPLYFSVHSAAARLAPEGAALVHVMRYLEPGEKPNRGQLLGELEAFVDLLQPGWRDRERARQFLGAMPVISAIPLAAKGGLRGRPAGAVDGAEGLFIAGDWVGPAGMLGDAAAASGRSAGEAAAAFARARHGVPA